MKALAALSFVAIALTICAADAAESDYSDIEVVAVVPRSAGLKPFVMASPVEKPIPEAERRAVAEKIAKLLASSNGALPSPSDISVMSGR
jgi:hypothetical protein